MTPARMTMRAGLATAAFAAILMASLAGPTVGAVATDSPLPLQLGSRGALVRTLQYRLMRIGYLPRASVDGYFDMRTWHAVVAFEGWQGLRRDGVIRVRTMALLRTARRPRPWVWARHALELDIHRQVMLVVDNGRTWRTIHVSTARPGYRTPTGRYSVYRRERLSWSAPFQTWMPYALYFSGGYAVHGYADVPAEPASHGCVRMPLMEAPWVYAATPLRTAVLIR